MPKYIAILRGINVSGRKKILMKDLKILFQNLGFQNITTYIQSGNIAFEELKNEQQEDICEKIKTAIFEQYNFEVPVLVRKKEELKSLVIKNPFLKVENINTKELYVTFLAELPNTTHFAKLKAIEKQNFLPDDFVIIEKTIYVRAEKYGKTKLSNNFFERKLKVSATTRNWKTVLRLCEMATQNEKKI